ncbi:hypothetical protein [Nocardioides sp. SR21]|uniref:hypothetical protein n=1 Tax=Nocardioides sp. SR21 TaxID=2919501 RepID=UPI001FAAE085|nr:hypothetical protein [Nocardioides sp. SR21]
MRSRVLLVALVAVLAAGCTSDPSDPGARPTRTPDPLQQPAPFAAGAQAPAGWTTTQCADLRSRRNTGMATRFAVPPTFSWSYRDDGTCSFGASFARELAVSVGPMHSLRHVKETDVDPFVGTAGDDHLEDVSYAADVPVYGDRRGEHLEYYCYCDGQDLDVRVVQADGVRVQWTTPHGRSKDEDDYRAVTDTLALLRSGTSTCSARGLDRSAAYDPPIPQTESIDNAGDGCHLYLQPGRNSLQRYAEVVPEPRRTLEQLAAALRRNRHVAGAEVSGDRLTWRYVERGTTWRGVTVERDGVQVTWSATPRLWRQEADVYRAFVSSVRLLPQ